MAARNPWPHCRTCCRGFHGLFGELEDAHLEALERAVVIRRYDRGQFVCREGEPADALHCVRSGILKLYKSTPHGDEIVIRLLREGDVIGFRPLFAHEPLAASALAIGPATVCAIAASAILDLVRRSPRLALGLLNLLATEMRVSEDEMVARVSMRVPRRIARFLLWLAPEDSRNSRRFAEIDLPLRREDMAQAIGIAPETLSRALHDLEARGIIRLGRGSVHVGDFRQLQALAAEAPAPDPGRELPPRLPGRDQAAAG